MHASGHLLVRIAEFYYDFAPGAQEKRRHTRGSDRPFSVTAGVIRIALPRFQELLRRTGLKEEAEI